MAIRTILGGRGQYSELGLRELVLVFRKGFESFYSAWIPLADMT
jgi:hypothetical protein